MNKRDPKLTALMFNEFINNRDLEGLAGLMTEDHIFIDRHNVEDRGKDSMTRGWKSFFEEFPEYRNVFTSVESRDDLVLLQGYALWSRGGEPDHVIRSARIRGDLVAEWRIYEETEQNRIALGLQGR